MYHLQKNSVVHLLYGLQGREPALKFADVTRTGSVGCQFELRYEDHILSTPEHRITAKQLALGEWDLFKTRQNESSVLDLVCLRLTHTACALDLHIPVPASVPLVEVLRQDLGLEDVTGLAPLAGVGCEGDAYLCGRTPMLSGLLLLSRHVDANKHFLQVQARDETQLLLFSSALLEVLPYGTQVDSRLV